MISSVGANGSVYTGLAAEKSGLRKSEQSFQSSIENNKAQAIKKEIEDGDYKVNITKLSEKIADMLI